MEEQAKAAAAPHVLILPYPAQGHINPMLQFGKHLATKGLNSTLATTRFILKSTKLHSTSLQIDTISDGFDDTGYAGAKSTQHYLYHLQTIGSQTLSQLITKHQFTQPFSCLIYDAVLPWALDVGKNHGLLAASFFSQPSTVNTIVYYVYHGMLPLPISSSLVSIPGAPFLRIEDLPSFIGEPRQYPAYVKSSLNKYSNIDKADFLLVNTVYELEKKVLDEMSSRCPMMTIGPTIPSAYLDSRVETDKAYGLNLYNQEVEAIIKWLRTRPHDSVVYVSFGSVADLGEEQMKELALGLKQSGCSYLWVIRDPEQAKAAEIVLGELDGKGMIVNWCPQLEVLASDATGCFLTHCGWNSTLEALCLGVRMVAMPQWADQPTNGALIQDVWRVGRRVRVDEKGFVRSYEIAACVREVLNGKRSEEMKANAERLGSLIKAALGKDGSSARNIDEFVSKIRNVNL